MPVPQPNLYPAFNIVRLSHVEFGVTDEIFIKPKKKATEDYITGRFG